MLMLGDEIIDNVYVPDQLYSKTHGYRENREKGIVKPKSSNVQQAAQFQKWTVSLWLLLEQVFQMAAQPNRIFGDFLEWVTTHSSFWRTSHLWTSWRAWFFLFLFFLKGPLSSRLGQNKVGEREDKGMLEQQHTHEMYYNRHQQRVQTSLKKKRASDEQARGSSFYGWRQMCICISSLRLLSETADGD